MGQVCESICGTDEPDEGQGVNEMEPQRAPAAEPPAGSGSLAFMDRLAPNGQRWADYCGPAPPALNSEGKLAGAWAECVNSAVIFEITNPGWDQLPGYQDNGSVGQVIGFCRQIGFASFYQMLEEAEGYMKDAIENAPQGDARLFLRHVCKNGRSWYSYLQHSTPNVDKQGFVNGAWGECLTAAVIFEYQNPNWSSLPGYMEDGPAGQVLKFAHECGHGGSMDAFDLTEEASHQAFASGQKVPVFKEVYQAISWTEDAPEIGGEAPELTGKRKAVLMGCNYPGSSAELRGCINDVKSWQKLLMEVYGFDPKDMVILTDDQSDPRRLPTLQNMRASLQWLVAGAAAGDILFWQYSGHGGQQESANDNEEDGLDEMLCPTDYQKAGCLVDDEIFDLVVAPLCSGVKLTIVLDCCHSGTAVDLPFNWNGSDWEVVGGTSTAAGDVQMFSGCEDNECSMDAVQMGRPGGAMSVAMDAAIREDPERNYPELLDRLKEILQERGFEQQPRLSSCQKFHPQGKSFSLCQNAIPNQNAIIGSTGPPRKHDRRENWGDGFLWT